MGAIAVHHTAVVDRPWDGPAAVAAASSDASVLSHMAAWRDPKGDPTAKSTYKFWHHGPGSSSPAVKSACDAILANLAGARSAPNIPSGDHAGVHAHAQAHLNDAGS